MGIKTTEKTLPLLPLRGLIVYPGTVLHLDVGREKSIKALDEAMLADNELFLATQKEVNVEEPSVDDIYRTGTVARVRQMLKLPNGTIRVLVEGLARGKLLEYVQEETFFRVKVEQMTRTSQIPLKLKR